MEPAAIYYDGATARNNHVVVELVGKDISFIGPSGSTIRWSLEHLHPIDPPTADQPFRLSHANFPGARLIVRDQEFINQILAVAPHLGQGYYTPGHVKQVAIWTLGGLATLAAVGYIFIAVLPNQVGRMLPEEWRTRIGKQVEKSVINEAKECRNADGLAALSKLLENLAQGGNDLPPITMTVYDMDLLNAFAVSGGRLIFTKEIVKKAGSPDELAGVIAHEIGHVAHFHPEEQLVRISGLQVLLSIVGAGSGEYLSSIAGLAALLQYSREAEREADAYANGVLQQAQIDPTGLKRFFEKIMKIEGEQKSPSETTALTKIGNIFSTHPDTKARIDAIKPLSAGKASKSSLTDSEWKDLQSICD